jgi:hypothetical protein
VTAAAGSVSTTSSTTVGINACVGAANCWANGIEQAESSNVTNSEANLRIISLQKRQNNEPLSSQAHKIFQK